MDQTPLDIELLGKAHDDWLDSLLDMPTDEQVAALDELAKETPELARRLRSVVLDGLLDNANVDGLLSSHEAQAGDIIGAWTLDQVIGKGGMGTVWRAHRTDGDFEQTVAIKLLPASLSTQATRKRFERERQLLAKLRHPGIAALYDGGLTKHKHLWFALEYVPGISLTDYCLETGLSLDARLVLFAEACEAVAYAHERGVIHRDLKPHNMLVDEQAGEPRVVLLDFGIASQEAQSSKLTLTGLIMGTPGYMSPEQARGDIDSVDRRSDVFALGIVLYELISREHPFIADTPSETVYAILREEPRAISRRDIPRDLLAIISHCLEKKQRQRYPSVVPLYEDIRAYLRGERVSVRTPGTLRLWRRRIRRHPIVSTIVAMSMLAVTIAVGAAAWWSLDQARIADDDVALVEQVTASSQALRDQVRLTFMRPEHNIEPRLATARADFARLQEQVDSVTSRSRPTLTASLGITAQFLGMPEQALDYLSQSWRNGATSESLFIALVDTYTTLYFAEVNRARQTHNKELRERSIGQAQVAYLQPAQDLILRHGNTDNPLLLAHKALLEKQYQQVIEYSRQARAQFEWPWPAWQVEAQAWLEQAEIALSAGNYELAQQHYAQAGGVLQQAADFARSLPAVAVMQCQLDASSIYATELLTLAGEIYQADGCERLFKLSPGNERYRALIAVAYEMAAIRNLRFARDPGAALARARELVGSGELHTADAYFARGLADAIEGEQRLLSEGDSTQQLLQAADSFDAALAIDPERLDVRWEQAWALTLAGRSSNAVNGDGEPHYGRSHAVWNYVMDGNDPPLVAIQSRGDNLAEWAYDGWALGRPKTTEVEEMLIQLQSMVEANPQNKGFQFTLGTLQSILATEAYWRGQDPGVYIRASMDAFDKYMEVGYSYAAQNAQFSVRLLGAMYQHDNWQPDHDVSQLRTLAGSMLQEEGSLEAVDLTRAMLVLIEAQEKAIKGESPLADFARAREHLIKASELDIDRSEALSAYARTLWFEYRWRFKNEQSDCQQLLQQVEDLQAYLEQYRQQPFLRAYLVQLLREIPPAHQCSHIPGLGRQFAREQWYKLNDEHPIIAERLGPPKAGNMQAAVTQ